MATLNDIKILLKNRVGFRKPIDETFESLNADNSKTDSGLIFQDAHSMVSIKNIRNTQPISDIDDTKFNQFLTQLRESNVLEVLNDIFQGESEIDESLIQANISAFDKAIYLRMVLKVGEIILSSSRINETAYFNERMISQWRLDLNGSNDGAYKNPNYPFHSGYTSRYRREIKYIKSQFNNSEPDMLQTITLG